MSFYYNREGNAVGRDEAMAMMNDNRLLRDEVGNVSVSTVHLVINHGFVNTTPIIFETMVFGYDEANEYQWRYSTKEDATAGHAAILAAVKAGTLTHDFEPPRAGWEADARSPSLPDHQGLPISDPRVHTLRGEGA